MKNTIEYIRAFVKDTTGQDLAEYGIALAVIGVGAAAAALVIAGNVEILWENANGIIAINAN